MLQKKMYRNRRGFPEKEGGGGEGGRGRGNQTASFSNCSLPLYSLILSVPGLHWSLPSPSSPVNHVSHSFIYARKERKRKNGKERERERERETRMEKDRRERGREGERGVNPKIILTTGASVGTDGTRRDSST